jgi:hypothetical protein
MEAVLLTTQQAEEITNRKFAPDSYFSPHQDLDNNWVVSVFEQEHCTNPDFDWIKKCPRIEYKPKPYPMPEEQTPVQE